MRTSLQHLSRLGVAILLLGAAPRLLAQEPRVVEITAKRFEFDPKEITLAKGQPVTIRFSSGDVAHGLFQKKLGLGLTARPGEPAEVTITPQEPGRYLTICDHFCGVGHGNMKMTIVVE